MAIDIDHLDRATAGDRALQTELLRLFLDQLHAWSVYLGGGEPPTDLAGSLHRLKGASYAIGAVALADAIVEAEGALRQGLAEAALLDAVPRLPAAIAGAKSAADRLLAAPSRAGLAKAGESG